MQRQYDFAHDATAKGQTVLFYNRKAVGQSVKHIKAASFARRVKMIGADLFVDGQSVKGWTICVKP